MAIKLITAVVVLFGIIAVRSSAECIYPTYYDSGSSECVETCPSGYIGSVSGTGSTTMRNCTALSTGYMATFNATHYEFDVNVYSPVGTVVFEALLFVENTDVLLVALANFVGIFNQYRRFSINGMGTSATIALPTSSNLLTITLDEALDPTGDNADYMFMMDYFVTTFVQQLSGSVNVIIHEVDPCDDCVLNSTCEVQSDLSAVCVCPDGYNGTNCEIYIGFCHSDPCMNGGTCIDEINNFTCQCSPGYEGRLCEINIDDCDPNPCIQGVCKDLINDYNCTCNLDFTGQNCSARFNDCLSDPCENNGVCIDRFAGYTCECPDGITGDECEVIIDQCDPNPCVNNGTCDSFINNYTCTCPTGYTSRNCSELINYCMGVLCMNNGICVNFPSEGIYSCRCSDGFTGQNCETEINFCNPNPCDNGGTCTDLVDDFMCDCPDGFTGRACFTDIDDCISNPCENGGTCTDLTGHFTCNCSEGMTGQRCEINVDNCNNITCQNNGTCLDQLDDFTCQCSSGFIGRFCEDNINDCDSVVCENNGTCVDGIDRFTCVCDSGYTGTICNEFVMPTDCDSSPCLNNATCFDFNTHYACVCLSGYTGRHCESLDNLVINCDSDKQQRFLLGLAIGITCGAAGTVVLVILIVCVYKIWQHPKKQQRKRTNRVDDDMYRLKKQVTDNPMYLGASALVDEDGEMTFHDNFTLY